MLHRHSLETRDPARRTGHRRDRHRVHSPSRAILIALLGLATLAAGACTKPPAPATKLTVTASSATIAYGDAVPEVTANYSQTPTTPATCTTTATSASPVGTYPTTCVGATLTGKTVVYVAGTITITPAPVTVTASSATITVGDPVPAITATYAGFKHGETVPAVGATCSTQATDTSPAGTYASICNGAAHDNYSFSYIDGSVEIAAAVVTVMASSGSSTYGQTPPAITASYAGFQHGETAPAVAPSCSSAADATSPVGSYPTTCSGASDPSYSFVYVPGTLTVAPAPLNVIASSASFVAGQAVPAITPTYSGLVNDDTAPSVAPVCTTDATSSSPPGTYTSSCSGASDPNYAIGYTDGTVEVTTVAAPVVVTASSATITYGDAIPQITASYAGFGGGQTVPATPPNCSTTAAPGSDVGTYTTTCAGAADPNHTFTYSAGTLTITPAPATVTASSASSTYGDALGAITPSYAGLVNGDTAPATPPTCSTTATSASPVGSYPSTCSGAADPNYTFGYAAGTVTIGKAPVTVTASDATFEEGDAVPAITAAYAGFRNGATTPATPPTCSTTATSASPVGTYASTCSGATDPNHSFSYVDGTVTVTAAALPPITATGHAGYSTMTNATTIAAGSGGVNLPTSTINVASTAGFKSYVNLTIPTANGAQPVFCKGFNATQFTYCTGGTGTMTTGATVTNGSRNGFDVYTIMGGAAAVSPSSLTVIQDIPAAFRGMNSTVAATATNGVITALPTPAATGTFNLVFGICDAGTATYSKNDPTCRAGEIVYGPGGVSTMGAKVTVSIASSNVYQKLHTFVTAPATVSQNDTFTVHAAAAGSSVPKLQPSSVGDATVNNANGFGIIFPIPAGMQYVSASASGGDATTSGKMVVKYCTATGTGCTAKLTGNFDATTLPYIQVTLPGLSVAGGATMTMPTISLTMKATGAVGTVANATLNEFMLTTSITAPIIGGANAVFDGYPTDPAEPATTPPKKPPAILASVEITN